MSYALLIEETKALLGGANDVFLGIVTIIVVFFILWILVMLPVITVIWFIEACRQTRLCCGWVKRKLFHRGDPTALNRKQRKND